MNQALYAHMNNKRKKKKEVVKRTELLAAKSHSCIRVA
jgi:hypothetical protein